MLEKLSLVRVLWLRWNLNRYYFEDQDGAERQRMGSALTVIQRNGAGCSVRRKGIQLNQFSSGLFVGHDYDFSV